VLAYLWVRQEIIHGGEHRPNSWLVAAGAWSYSLYLMHAQGGTLYGWLHIPKPGLVAEWFIVLTCSLVFAYVFFLLVERPSHKLARSIKVKGARKVVDMEKTSQSLPPGKNPLAKEVVQL